MEEQFTAEELQQALDEAVIQGLLKTVEINGETCYVHPNWHPPMISDDTCMPQLDNVIAS